VALADGEGAIREVLCLGAENSAKKRWRVIHGA